MIVHKIRNPNHFFNYHLVQHIVTSFFRIMLLTWTMNKLDVVLWRQRNYFFLTYK